MGETYADQSDMPEPGSDLEVKILRAMATGDTRGLSAEDYFPFVETGTAHLLAASGFHLLVIAALTIGLLRLIQGLADHAGASRSSLLFRREGELILILLAAILFTLFAGWPKSLVRALGAMALVIALEFRGGRPRLGALVLAAGVIALVGRGGLLSLALSCLAVLSLAYPPLLIRRSALWLRISLSPWLGTLPLVVGVFHIQAMGAPIHNLILASIWSFTVLPMGIFREALLQLNISTRTLDTFALPIVALLYKALAHLAAFFPLALAVPFWPWLVGTILLLGAWWSGRNRGVIGVAGALLLLACIRSPWAASALDVGQGDAILLERDGKNFLVDLGRSRNGLSGAPVLARLAERGIGSLDGVLLTHLDSDHSGALSSVLSRYGQEELSLWLPCVTLREEKSLTIVRAAEKYQSPIHCIDVEVENPMPGLACVHHGRIWDENSASPLCQFKLPDGLNMILLGDSDARAEKIYLHLYPELARGEVLKISHHGSRFSTDPDFLRGTGAKEAWISVGKNSYGHPHPSVLARLKENAVRIRRTDRDGTLSTQFF